MAREPPSQSGRPIESWTGRELAAEAAKREIVKSISASQVSRYLAEAELQPHRSKYWLNTDDLAGDIREPEITLSMAIGQLLMVQVEQIKQSRMRIMHRDLILNRRCSEFIGRTKGSARRYAASSEPNPHAAVFSTARRLDEQHPPFPCEPKIDRFCWSR